jgi:hypothetical protein
LSGFPLQAAQNFRKTPALFHRLAYATVWSTEKTLRIGDFQDERRTKQGEVASTLRDGGTGAGSGEAAWFGAGNLSIIGGKRNEAEKIKTKSDGLIPAHF